MSAKIGSKQGSSRFLASPAWAAYQRHLEGKTADKPEESKGAEVSSSSNKTNGDITPASNTATDDRSTDP